MGTSGDNYLVGVDIGGTALKVGVVNLSGEVVVHSNTLLKDKSFTAVCDLIVAEVRRLARQVGISVVSDLRGIGIVMPGKVEPNTGVSYFRNIFCHTLLGCPFQTSPSKYL